MDSQRVSALNFATSPDTDGFTMPHKRPRTARDPMSHRIIEKRRRDRMNNCLADLSHLIPASYLKQGQGRIEKTEIIEMAIKHIKHLQMLHLNRSKEKKQDVQSVFVAEGDTGADKFYMGFRECMDEMMRFLVEKQGFSASDPICMQMIRHLQEHSQQFLPPGGISGMTKPNTPTETASRPNLQSPDNQSTDVKEQSSGNPQHRFSSTEDENSQMDTAVADSVYQRINRNILDIQSCTSDNTDQSFMEDETASKADSGIASSISMNTSDYMSKSASEDYYRHGLSESSMSEQQQRDQHIYKFKNDIKSRFQSDVNSVGAEERDSISDVWADEEKEEKKQARPSSPSLASSANSSTPYPNSDTSSSNGNGQCHTSTTRRVAANSLAPTHVPGFALHSSGTYYIPVVIHSSSYTMVFRADQQSSQGMGILHPISIPVSFGGPIIPARNGVCTNPPSSRSPNNSNSSGSNSMESSPKKPKVT